MVTMYQRVPSLNSCKLLIPRANGLGSPGACFDWYALNACVTAPKVFDSRPISLSEHRFFEKDSHAAVANSCGVIGWRCAGPVESRSVRMSRAPGANRE